MKKAVILGLVLLIALLVFPTISYAASMLEINQVDAKVDEYLEEDIGNGDTISEEAEPGSSVRISIEAESNFRERNLMIEDIEINVEVEDLYDTRDLKMRTGRFDLRGEASKTYDLFFDIPLEVEDGTFKIRIEAEGKDENRTLHYDEHLIYLRVEKKSRELMITRLESIPEPARCNEEISFAVEIINLGRKKEDNAMIDIFGASGLIAREAGIRLSNDPFDDGSKFRNSYYLLIPSNTSGQFTVRAMAYFDGIPADEKIINFNVVCGGNNTGDTAPSNVPAEDVIISEPAVQADSVPYYQQTDSVPETQTDPVAEYQYDDPVVAEDSDIPYEIEEISEDVDEAGIAIEETFNVRHPKPYTRVSQASHAGFFESRNYLIALAAINIILACGIIYMISLIMKRK